MSIEYAWLGIMIACIVIEAISMGLTTVWFAIGAFVVALLSMTGIGITAQIIIFLAISIFMLMFTRPIALKYFRIGKEKTNIDSLIGERAKVVTAIDNLNNVGNVKINGQTWSARSSNGEQIEINEVVIIEKIQGVKLIVVKN